jgi:hypothetical protein
MLFHLLFFLGLRCRFPCLLYRLEALLFLFVGLQVDVALLVELFLCLGLLLDPQNHGASLLINGAAFVVKLVVVY